MALDAQMAVGGGKPPAGMARRNGVAPPRDAVAGVPPADGVAPLARARPANGAASDVVARLEAILFVADEPVAVGDLAKILDVGRKQVETAVGELERRGSGGGVRVQRSGQRVQLVTAPEVADAVAGYLGLEASSRLSKPALETLAIIAYQQPVTKPEIETLRGVNCDAVVRTLIGRGLVVEKGRRDTVGLPIEYATTFRFLEYFGLPSLDGLPPVEEFVAAAAGPVGDGAVGDD